MRITALVKSHDHVCCRYRIAAFQSALADAGHTLDIRPWSLRHLIPSSLGDIDTLIVQRRLFPAWQLHWLRRHVRRLIFDFDDAIFLHTSYNPRGQDCPRRALQFREMMHAADIVIAGNTFLAEQAMGFAEPAKVHVIPTCVDVRRYALACHDNRQRVQLAWIGSASTLRGLEKIRDLLEHFGKEISALELKIVCDRSLSLQHLPVRFSRWQEMTETAELASADIGISWLPDDAWSEGKCGLKILQYMAAGLPVVANPVGVQKKLVRHGETGFLVETPDEWLQAIRWLARDPDLRRSMGRAGRQLVEAEYEVATGEAGWVRVMNAVSEVYV